MWYKERAVSFNRLDLEYERYEVYVKSDLFSERRMVGSCATLLDAQERAESIISPLGDHSFKSIDYIGLYKDGRDEKFWVQSLEDQILNGDQIKQGDWIPLNGPALEPLEAAAVLVEVEVQ